VPKGVRFAAPITPGFGALLLSRLAGVPPPTGVIDTMPSGLLDLR
jgi:hypothetical protein